MDSNIKQFKFLVFPDEEILDDIGIWSSEPFHISATDERSAAIQCLKDLQLETIYSNYEYIFGVKLDGAETDTTTISVTMEMKFSATIDETLHFDTDNSTWGKNAKHKNSMGQP